MTGFRFFAGACGSAPEKPKPLLMTAIFLRTASGIRPIEGMAREASVVNTKRPDCSIRPGWISGLARPEICDQNTLRMAGKRIMRKTFEQARMVPEFELDDVGRGRQPRHMIEPVGNDDARAAGFDRVRVAAVARLFEQEKGLLYRLFGQGAT